MSLFFNITNYIRILPNETQKLIPFAKKSAHFEPIIHKKIVLLHRLTK